jgi:hypothetical protein
VGLLLDPVQHDTSACLVRERMDETPERYEWAEELAELLNREGALDPSEWPDAPWPTWRWATVMTAISWGIEKRDGMQ